MYDKAPYLAVGNAEECLTGWRQIASAVAAETSGVVCVECYPGVFIDEVEASLRASLPDWRVLRTETALLTPDQLEARFTDLLTDDPVFGRMSSTELEEFFDPASLSVLRESILNGGNTVVLGTGATLVCPKDSLLVYADVARWELQRRQREDLIPNLGLDNEAERASLKYKRAFFLDWRAADRTKQRLLPRINFLLDTNTPAQPRMISGEAFRRGLRIATTRPFRVVPFFDPGPWGGHWMERVCDLPDDGAPNHAWCFDCVPEENSLLLGFGDLRVEIPAIDVVL